LILHEERKLRKEMENIGINGKASISIYKIRDCPTHPSELVDSN
jgi:hypothetical protein